jgi:hypothetical protein
MATAPQPPRPPVPPQPPRNRFNLLIISVLLLMLILVIAGLGALLGLRYLSNAVHVHVAGEGAQKEVSIQTPLGSLEVNKDVNEASLGLPIYPGATRLKNEDSATVNIDIADQTKVRVLAGKFETPDSVDKVTAFYHDRLGTEVTSFKERDAEGKTVFEIKSDKQQRIVTLKDRGGKTVIELVRVSEGQSEPN